MAGPLPGFFSKDFQEILAVSDFFQGLRQAAHLRGIDIPLAVGDFFQAGAMREAR